MSGLPKSHRAQEGCYSCAHVFEDSYPYEAADYFCAKGVRLVKDEDVNLQRLSKGTRHVHSYDICDEWKSKEN